ncbi:2-polyprenyl-6-methoxyphenol hydroxylase-like FAD-dependent oxidoreductase [Saccharothrix ecbatanensis]|uniref:2-polyprenyl-6-methoxyphenol hydroxylase-like FAD-dependent oxidoreductase n=1 Tax=Saccharothrix ecbatanensis TaxID=1105145 RepID=A0A7W9HF63_9PSEU|nr:FAD-dependent monooxygenase [Saccharothrix ecbatanensis]MBB5800813.1 2-polyprenyl-6-methoxyphenol hydroxylase-like FAD-dependent oxidoreductase [Saccharothrix ecbatanensis]
MGILISGASVAGPVLAHWLARYGFEVTVVERAPGPRKTGGHSVDLFRPAMDIAERMGVLPQILELATGTDRMIVHSQGKRPVEVDMGTLFGAVSNRHVEIMRDDLAEVFYDATRDNVDYLFGDSITSITDDGDGVEVTFEHREPRRFDLVIGADGLHSNVRRLVFGDVPELFIGAYLAVLSLPNYLDLHDSTLTYTDVGRMAAMYSTDHLPDARAAFLFRSDQPLVYHYRDVERQKELLREAFADMGGEVARWLDHMDGTFYFDSITQLQMDTWSRGRVSLVGDAGCCPGPAVGGGTSLAVVAAYVLAGELAAAHGDPAVAFPAYEAEIGDYVRRSRAFAVGAAKRLVPATSREVWTMRQALRLFAKMPSFGKLLAKLNSNAVRVHDSVVLKDYALAK